ncbi:7-deoxyloganetic acid glucosyltransferase-like [Chenopodium quinoa]|uniref:7-deoxyloganetic acid glucosyltransferase-like n=1 Tax=Chenopodium quinoa TaxID=63459 RepID=UPI000B790A76|nr:7-deoxyloganetic acid glucosyltransferase-like [Chenopodium quinoa]XP_021772698.1 7-deoxyloganetic acid glucosyltransferase-like [Chenopodium quinoa]
MAKMEHQSSPTPHVLIFPLPVQGHVTPMLHLAELLCLAHLQVTFLNTNHNHQLLTQNTNIEARFSRYLGFTFKTIPDDWPPQNRPRPQASNVNIMKILKAMVEGMAPRAEPLIRELLFGTTETDKVTCFIIDGWLSFAYDLAKEAEVPVIAFRCSSACGNWSYFCIPQLIEAGEVPFKENEEMDRIVCNVLGMESFLRYRDLPSFCRGKDKSSCDDLRQYFMREVQQTKQAQFLILNTFEDLEGPILSQIRSQCSQVYPIGPLHAHLKYRLGKEETPLSNNSSSSLWEVDKSCTSWLDLKPDKSVIYVSFGSTTTFTADQLMELWAGLVQSKKYFLWVVRPNIIASSLDGPIPEDLLEGTKKRGYKVKWAPQDEVLAHRAIGGFLTHSGWNSTLESIIAGVPMLCWPYFSDQQVNSRFVSQVWGIGLDMKDTCDRSIVEKMINEVMDEKKEELCRSMDNISQAAKRSIAEGGSSYSNLNHLIDEIQAMSKKGGLKSSSSHQ